MSSTETNLSVAVDVGGTFTDIALLDQDTGQIWRAKTPSVPSDPSEAFLAGSGSLFPMLVNRPMLSRASCTARPSRPT